MRLPLLLALALALAAPATAAPLALTGGTVIDGTGGPAFAPGNVIIDHGRILCAGTTAACPAPRGAKRFDAKGKFVMPGLVDAHVHLGQTGWIDGRPDGISAPALYPYAQTIAVLRADPLRWQRAYLCSGVTAAYDVGGQPWTIDVARGSDANPDGVHLRAAGPLVTQVAARVSIDNLPGQPTFIPLPAPADAPATVARLKAMGSHAVKLWFIAPKPGERADIDARVMALGAAVKAAGLPLIVHATELREAKVALSAGASYLVHDVFDAPVDDAFLALFKANHAVMAPTLVVGAGWTQAIAAVASGRAPTVRDPNGCVDAAIRDRIAHPERLRPFADKNMLDPARLAQGAERTRAELLTGSRNLAVIYRAGGRIVLGTDAGNPLTLHGPSVNDELEAMQAAGIPPSALIPIATRNGAQAMGGAALFGTLTPGKAADLIVLEADPRADIANVRRLAFVMRAGKMHAQSTLRSTQAAIVTQR
jgi:imidazolonepropionase-like amidohydrolase